ncbi:MAG TPA: TerB family tellurite resistance protein [Rhodocyclaceae bacterium]|nr:TerB family tellurite resistance protein [Rhodocyclaceae bacterium]
MRPYPLDSAQAAARIVALAMLADGNLTRAELDALADSDGQRRLGLWPGEWHEIVSALCEDLISSSHQSPGANCNIDARGLAALMAEVDDPGLREKVMDLCVAVVDADAQLSEGEMVVLRALGESWSAQRAVSQTA